MNLIAHPTAAYLYNNHILGVNLLSGTETKKPQMQALYETYHMSELENRLKSLTASYPSLKPSIYGVGLFSKVCKLLACIYDNDFSITVCLFFIVRPDLEARPNEEKIF